MIYINTQRISHADKRTKLNLHPKNEAEYVVTKTNQLIHISPLIRVSEALRRNFFFVQNVTIHESKFIESHVNIITWMEKSKKKKLIYQIIITMMACRKSVYTVK